jgi:hypothetical protein
MLDFVTRLYLNHVASGVMPTLSGETFWHEHPIAFCLRRARSVCERRL